MVDKHVDDPAADRQADAADSADVSAAVSTDTELADLKKERDDLFDRLLRKTAEFDNYRKRIDRERRELADQGLIDLLLDLLLVVDDFELALAADAGEGSAAYRKGVEIIHTKLLDLLRRRGVAPVESLGKDFDPNVHQAVVHEASPGHREGEVIGELRRGYTIGDKLLRPAMVKVAKA
jgi:molecular chaperone GrpE